MKDAVMMLGVVVFGLALLAIALSIPLAVSVGYVWVLTIILPTEYAAMVAAVTVVSGAFVAYRFLGGRV